eukprot:s650_g1.t1
METPALSKRTPKKRKNSGEFSAHQCDLDKELDDSWLEEELLGFCVQSPGMDEQQRLMSLLEEVSPQSGAAEGRQSDLSVEVF